MSSDTTRVSPPQTPTCDQPGGMMTLSRRDRCQAGIADAYYEVSGHMLRLDSTSGAEPSRSGLSRMLRVAAFGFGGALAGAGIHYAFPDLPRYEVGLVAVGAGWLVSRLGADGGGGWGTRLSPGG